MKALAPSPLALAILSLASEAPMHPYRMHQLLKLRHKADVINLRQRATVYQMIPKLERQQLLKVAGTQKSDANPERTLYEVTDLGRQTALEWLTVMMTSVRNEYPAFPAAISYITMVEPAAALRLLEQRKAALRLIIDKMTADLHALEPGIPDVLLLENRFSLRMIAEEYNWVEGVITRIEDKSLDWSVAQLRTVSIEMEKAQLCP